jgi:hypothetical protein
LGRLGNHYEQTADTGQALNAYQRALQIETDIPAIYGGLLGLLVNRGEIGWAFQVADQRQQQGARHLGVPAHTIFIGLGTRLTSEERYLEAIALLSRTADG